jgi:hypothetical protein
MPSHDTARRIARLALVLAALASASTLGAQGTMRELYCRGKAGLALKVDQDPSPRDTRDVVMVLEYARSTALVRDSVQLIAPGTCTWNPYQHPSIPVEPGRVRFDVRRQAQAWTDTVERKMDTTVGGARFFPDPISLPRYLNDPRHYWKFFVNDATNLSSSFGQAFDDGLPTYVMIRGPVTLANDVRRDLVCRGGSAGLRFGGGGTVGDNLAKVVLSYRVSATVPGPAGYGLSPGACAWTDRTAMPEEPGKIAFITARNAQIKQAQSGSIDRSPTAAERYPDVFTIPKYLEDPQHYWTFAVMSKAPDSALTNGPWKRDLTAVIATGRTTTTSQTVSLPSSVPGGGVFRPGGAGSTSVVQTVYDIKDVSITPLLENAVFYFVAAPNIAPTVTITPATGGPAIAIPVRGTSVGTMWRYLGESKTPLARNTTYNYTISAPASGNARANSTSGTFRTLRQDVSIVFSEINVIMDGDASGDGELFFKFGGCPNFLSAYDPRMALGASYVWKEGRHRLANAEMRSQGASAPDRFRVLVEAYEDDYDADDMLWVGYLRAPRFPTCGSGVFDIPPSRNAQGEWTSVAIDFDLTKYPGLKGGEQFLRRSKALVAGVSVMFEIRGAILVTRQ